MTLGSDICNDRQNHPDGDESRHFMLFNDLTYSDDEDGDEWQGAERSFGGDSHASSPETAALLNEIEKAMLSPRSIPNNNSAAAVDLSTSDDNDDDDNFMSRSQEQSHLIHPLVHFGSFRNSEGDDGSQLAYSITSSVMSSPNPTPNTNYGSLEPAAPYFDYNNSSDGNSIRVNTSSHSYININNNSSKTATVIFRSPPNVFHSSQSNDSLERTKTKFSSILSNPVPRYLKPKIQHPNQSTEINRLYQKTSNTSKGVHSVHHPSTPLPSITNISPATSATATDTTESPVMNDIVFAPHPPPVPSSSRRKFLSREDKKRLKKHRRTRRIKKEAEEREALVQQVRGVEQQTSLSSNPTLSLRTVNDSIFAYVFLCQLLLVFMTALAFGSGALWEMINKYISLDNPLEDECSGAGATTTTAEDHNPFAGLETDDVIITDVGIDMSGRKSGRNGVEMSAKMNATDGISDIDFINVIQLVCIASGYACLCSLLSLGFMMMLSKNALHVMLIFTITLCLAWTILGWMFSLHWSTPLAGAFATTVSIGYTTVVWNRIVFAATNLSVALKGMRSRRDIPCVGCCVLTMTFFWTVLWIFALISSLNFLSDNYDLSDDLVYVMVALFLFSYYWTFQVIKGIAQTTVASIIGKWWEVAEDDPLPKFNADIRSTWAFRIKNSIGSICLGSLIVEPCVFLSRIIIFGLHARQTLTYFNHSKFSHTNHVSKRRENASRLPYCENALAVTVNQWSFVYIGLYGYKFWDSGHKASQLFEARGWTHVVSDDLIMTVIGISSMIIGGSTALLGLIVEEVDGYYFTSSIHNPIATTFLICLCAGYILSSAFMSIVEGCISAILVCYAAYPVEFHENHYELSEEMKSAWRHLWTQKSR